VNRPEYFRFESWAVWGTPEYHTYSIALNNYKTGITRFKKLNS